LFAPDADELHEFAARIGLRRASFQDPKAMPHVSWPHYDINETRRVVALETGAVAVTRDQMIVMSKVCVSRYLGIDLDPLSLFRQRQSPRLPALEAWLAQELTA